MLEKTAFFLIVSKLFLAINYELQCAKFPNWTYYLLDIDSKGDYNCIFMPCNFFNDCVHAESLVYLEHNCQFSINPKVMCASNGFVKHLPAEWSKLYTHNFIDFS